MSFKRYKRNKPTSEINNLIRGQLAIRDGYDCFYCGYAFNEEFQPTIEHLICKSVGGRKHLSNLVLACQPCNYKVGNWPLIKKIKYREYRLKTKI